VILGSVTGASRWASFADSQDPAGAYPKLEITYIPAPGTNGNGLEDYYETLTWGIGGGTNLHVTLTNTRNIVITKGLVSIPGRGIGINLGLAYNRRADWTRNDTNLGSNWQLSIPKLRVDGSDVIVYDSDGSEHVFVNRTEDEDGRFTYQPSAPGIRYTLIEVSNTETYRFQHDSGLVHEFSSTLNIGDGSPAFKRLLKTYDTYHRVGGDPVNHLTYTYTDGYITSITDSSDLPRSVTLAWAAGHCSGSKVLTSITEPSGIQSAFAYSTSTGYAYLASVVEASGTADARTSHFGYETYSTSTPYAVITSVTDPMNNTTTVAYHSTGDKP